MATAFGAACHRQNGSRQGWLRQGWLRQGWLRECMAPQTAAPDLAVFRITVAIVIAASASVAVAEQWAALPVAARTAPLGVGWLVPHLPVTPTLVRGARWLLMAACFTGGVGLFSRTSFTVVAVLLFYVLLAPQLGGAVFHDHHLLWFAGLLAASPSGDALSVDAWRARRAGSPRPTHGRAHGLAIRGAWLLVGLIFLFPGVHKLLESGVAWVLSDNLRNQMWWKWAQDPTTQPGFRIDQHPGLLRIGAAATVLFELSFLPLVFWRRTRAFAVSAALLFHAATDVFMGIDFSVLYACYTVFVPWDRLRRRRRSPAPCLENAPREPLAATATMAVCLALGVAVAGVAGATQAYPFACYPTFQWMAPDRMPALAISLERDGRLEPLSPGEHREPGPRGWALEWRLVGAYDGVHTARLDAWWERLTATGPMRRRVRGASRVHFYRVELAVDPERRGAELGRTEIHSRAP